jgi:hypothetical protein
MKKLVSVLICLFLVVPSRAGTIYVDANAAGADNGSSWANAYKYLQDALTAAVSGTDIQVAQGTYKPDANTINPGDINDRTATFRLKNGVALYGGFPTGGGNRDPNIYVTFLSGDINVPGDNSDNSYHVVTSSGTNSTAVLDGFIITEGCANYGANNTGGGMYNASGSPAVTGCIFTGNSAFYGGGMFNNAGAPTLTNCIFIGNSATGGFGYSNAGGGIYSKYNNQDLILTNCTFSGNSACIGGGIFIYWGYIIITNCTFTGNSVIIGTGAYSNAGGGMYIFSGDATMTNCTFSGNSTYGGSGGGIYTGFSSSVAVDNSIFWGNTAATGPQIYNDGTSSSAVTFSDVQGGWTGTGNIDDDPLFIDANGPDNIPGTDDDNLRLSLGSPCIDTANDSAVPVGVETDLDGRDRFADGDCNDTYIVDMGAFEFTHAYLGDFDSDCCVDFIDFAIQSQLWLTDEFLVDIAPTPAGDGIVDTSDLAVLCDNWLETF